MVVDQLECNFRGDAKAATDYWDGEKMLNTGLNFYAVSEDNKKLSKMFCVRFGATGVRGNEE